MVVLHILKMAEKTKIRFKNVTMNAKNIYVFNVLSLQKCQNKITKLCQGFCLIRLCQSNAV